MGKGRIRNLMVAVIAAVTVTGAAGTLGTGVASAAPAAQAHTIAHVRMAVPQTPTSNRCTTPGHENPCWATTKNASDGGPYGCPNGVPLFLRSGGVHCLGGNDLVEITCYYNGSPTVQGDNYQDHVTKENAGSESLTGHIPDFFINLDNHNPPAVNIGHCG